MYPSGGEVQLMYPSGGEVQLMYRSGGEVQLMYPIHVQSIQYIQLMTNPVNECRSDHIW